ncbi:MAG: glycosyltransferase family 4 protein [Anaerolineae bacterium]
MKVVYSIGARFAGGGIGTTAYHGARGLHRHKMLHRLLCGSFRPTDIPASKIRSVGLPSRVLRKLATYDASKWLWYANSLLYDAWSRTKLAPGDLFYVWSNYGLRSMQRAKELGMITVVNHASTYPLHQARILQEEMSRWGLKFRSLDVALGRTLAEFEAADYVLIPSDFVRRTFLTEGFPERRLLKIPFGADIRRFCPAADRSAGPFRVLFVGQIGFRKGIPYLLEAWRRLGWRDAELWLAGRVEGGFQPFFDRWNRMEGVKVVGYVADPVALYQQADVFVFPTLEEGSALVTYEALACGLPVVTTPNAGSVVRDGIDGNLVPIRDGGAIAEALEQLRADERFRREMSCAAREQAETYTWQRHENRLAQICQQLIEQIATG